MFLIPQRSSAWHGSFICETYRVLSVLVAYCFISLLYHVLTESELEAIIVYEMQECSNRIIT